MGARELHLSVSERTRRIVELKKASKQSRILNLNLTSKNRASKSKNRNRATTSKREAGKSGLLYHFGF